MLQIGWVGFNDSDCMVEIYEAHALLVYLYPQCRHNDTSDSFTVPGNAFHEGSIKVCSTLYTSM